MPAREASDAVQAEQGARERTADDARDGNRGHEARDRAGALDCGEPVGEIENHAREKTCLDHAEQGAQRVKARNPAHQHHGRGDRAPHDHQAPDPAPRADPRENEVARDLKQAVAQKEHAGAESVCRPAEPQVAVHVERRETDVHAIQIVRDVQHEHERDETTGDPPQRRGFECGGGGRVSHRGAAARGDGNRSRGGRSPCRRPA